MFVSKKILVTLVFVACLVLYGAAAKVRFIPKPDSDFTFKISDHLSQRRVMEGYTPHKSNHTIVLRGDTVLGYYYATLFFGYPPQKETVIVDTGSSITAIPCKCNNSLGTVI